MTELQLQITTLTVELRHAESADHFVGLMARVQRHARIALALRIEEEAAIAGQRDIVVDELMNVALGLLQADIVGVLAREPAKQALFRGRANAADIQCNNSHPAILAVLVMHEYQITFIELAVSRSALRFGSFRLKSGRESPYFFNAGLFSDGEAAATLGRCYAAALLQSGVQFDMLFGPAYKGIPLATATAVALAQHHGRSVPFAFNRKEAKQHGEGGAIAGAALAGRVVIVDDVISDGAAKREAIELIRSAGATPVAVLLALDRQERGQGAQSAVEELETQYGIRCVSIVTLGELIEALAQARGALAQISVDHLTSMRAYRERYGAS